MNFGNCRREALRRVGLQDFGLTLQQFAARVTNIVADGRARFMQLTKSRFLPRQIRQVCHGLTFLFFAFLGLCLMSKSSTASRMSTDRGTRDCVDKSFSS